MSFYTALTGLNGSSADISATSNNIANVGTTGFKRSRAEFGDIFATSPLQNSSSSIGSGTILKGIKQQFTQGNIASSLNALDLAISGQGFLSLKPSLTSAQTVYTRNGSLNVNNDRYVVDSAGQYLLTYPVNEDGSVTAKDLVSAVPLQLPVTSGDPKATSNIKLGVNLPAAASVVTDQAIFADGYTFNPDNPDTFTNSTSITIFDDLGNPTIASIYFIKTQAADAADPTNKYDTRLVVGDTVIDPQLVSAVDDTGNQIFIDRFGKQTTSVPDDNYFIEGKGSALYKKDDLNTLVPSQRAKVTGDQTAFDFGEEGDKLVEIVTDPLRFNSTVEGGSSSTDKYWGKNFLTLNVDSADQPVNIDIRPGKYNATQLSAEVERAINESYGDDRKIQIVRNVDDKITIDLFKLNADGTTSSLDTGVISVDLLQDSFVTNTAVGDPSAPRVDLTGASPDFAREEFLAHTQSRINTALNEYAQTGSNATSLGVTNKQFNRAVGNTMTSIYTQTEIVSFTHKNSSNAETPKFLSYSYFDNTPSLSVYDKKATNKAANSDLVQVTGNSSGQSIVYDSKNNTMNIYLTGLDSRSPKFAANDKIRLAANWDATTTEAQTGNAYLNGREFTVSNVVYDSIGAAGSTGYIQIDTTGLGLPDNDFSLTTGATATAGELAILSSAATNVEAFFEGASNVFEGSTTNFSSKKIVMREVDSTAGTGSFKTFATTFGAASVLTDLGLNSMEAAASNSTDWVDELNPPIKVSYDEINQRLQFTVDRTVLGTGTDSNFNSFTVTGNATATSTNNIGIPPSDKAEQTLIRGGEILSTESFVADGEEIQLNDKRYGIQVDYSSDVKAFVISSGSTGETIPANGALGVTTAQKPSTIQVGRYALNAQGEVNASNASDYFASDNNLIGVGASKTDAIATDGTGLASSPAIAVGAAAKESLTDVFRLSSTANENVFNVSVNGINGVVTIPPGFYVGSTLAEALEERINQIMDPVTGDTVGGVRATYDAAANSFTFTTGTQGADSTIKVKGTARLGLDDVPLGVGTVPEIYNLVQATNADGIALYVNENGDVVETPPANLVTGYYPLYIDEGELTFDKSGSLVSPINNVRYEKQEQGFSISLDMDYSSSTQFAQPFSVLSVDQDGFTSGRLDGLEIDSSGTIRANYTNGQNNPLGKIVLANFNNQNGLKQIGNATYVETAVSGSAQVGEAGAEGFGTVLSGSLERSNVDITEELVNLITAQRNFQASAKAIETFGSLTQTIIQIRQ
ncbi:MAG: flagellar hook-basal body protein [Rhodobacteraceae bacterium]|nr:MAG: flagellar hook-basal body protein [Paracoccaceae bacterium]